MTSHIDRGRRVIGRILSLGFPLPGVRVDNYGFLSAPSFFDYDAIVVDPAALSKLIEGVIDGSAEVTTFAGAPLRNAPSQSGQVALADVLQRRIDETRRLLDNGGVVVCFAHPPQLHRIEGIDAIDDLYWLGELAPPLVPGDGTQVEVCDYQHAMAPFALGQLANIQYRAHLREAPHAFVRSYGGAAIGATLPDADGRVVMLPALKTIPGGDGRYAMSETVQAGIRRMLGIVAEGRPPQWLSHYPLPGLDERAHAVAKAKESANSASSTLTEAERAHDEIAKYQRLLWQQGQVGLDDIVLDALKLIGCSVYGNDPNAVELRVDGTRVLIEIDASDGAVGLAPHYRLRQRIERVIERGNAAPCGAIIINGYRLDPPDERKPQASDALRTAAATMRYGLIPTAAVFDAVAAKLAGDDGPATALHRELIECVGLLDRSPNAQQEQ